MAKSLCSLRKALLILPFLCVSQTPDVARDQEITAETPIIKVDIALVTTEVTVLGATALDLRAEHFIVLDNGVTQQVTHFSRDKLPLAVALLMDRSSSIKPYLPVLQKAAVSALGHLKAEDTVALFSFDDDLLKLSDLTADRSRIAGIIGKLTTGQGTNIYDAISSVADYLRRKAPQHRRAIILVSDNCQTVRGRIRGDSARVGVLESAATLYSIKTPGNNYALDMRVRDPGCHDSIVMVQQLAEETGGQVLEAEASPSLQEALEKAISNLRLQYTLGFSPLDPGQEGSFHKLTVRLAAEDICPACRLLVRSGYYAGSPPVPLANHIQLAPPEPTNNVAYSKILRKMEAAATINLDLSDIPFVARTAIQKDSDGKSQIRVNLQIDFAGVGFKTVGDRHTCKLHLAVFSVDERGNTLDPEFRTLEGTLQEETYNRVLKTGMSVSFAIPLKAPKQNLKIVLYDEGSDTLGSQRTRFSSLR
jgi:Ca-activated chloride channel homolog